MKKVTEIKEKSKMGRKPYSDPDLRKDQVVLFPTIYEIKLLGGKEALREELNGYLHSRIRAKEAEKNEGGGN
jgi:hypothetical protein